MRLWELFSDLDEKSLSDVEKDLDARVYQPAEKVAKGKEPVIDLDLESQPHFRARMAQRSQSAGISPEEVEQLFLKGREQHKTEIGKMARVDNPSQSVGNEIVFYDPESKLLSNTYVTPNPNCKPNSQGKIVCQTQNGPEPKNRLTAMTIMRKGTPD